MRSTLRTLLAVWLIVVAPMWLFAEQSKVKSPDGRLVVNVEDQEGRLFYEVFYDGRQMMLPSAWALWPMWATSLRTFTTRM